MSVKQVIEETQEICSLCGGRGTEYSHVDTSGSRQCRNCQGARYIVTKRVVRYEQDVPNQTTASPYDLSQPDAGLSGLKRWSR